MTVDVDVKAVREMLGCSKEELARRMGVSSLEISFLERRGNLSEAMATRLADVIKATHPGSPEVLAQAGIAGKKSDKS